MKEQKLLKIPVELKSLENNLEKILLYLDAPQGFFHVVSLNPENLVVAYDNEKFRNILSEGDIQLVDGVGIYLGGFLLGIQVPERTTGVDFMKEVLKTCKNRSLRVLFLGGRGDLAEEMANRYQNIYPSSFFKGISGISDIKHPTKEENEQIFSIVADYKPQILFVAFGSPYQEIWLHKHRDLLKRIICMGVGGGFDFDTGNVARAPVLIRKIGFEWLFRLLIQPWRWRRQLRLLRFIYLVGLQRIGLLER